MSKEEKTYKIELNLTVRGIQELMDTEEYSPDCLNIRKPACDFYIKEVLGAEKVEVEQRPGDTSPRLKYRLKDWADRPGPVFLSNKPKHESEGPFGGPPGETDEELHKRRQDHTRPQEAREWLITVGELIIGYVKPINSYGAHHAIEEAEFFLEKAIFTIADGGPVLVFEEVRLRDFRHPGAVISNKQESPYDLGPSGTLTIPLQ